MTIEELENMAKQNKLNPKYSYYIEELKDGFGVICAKSTSVFEKDAIVCCKLIEECRKLLEEAKENKDNYNYIVIDTVERGEEE